MLERLFKLRANDTTIATEVLAGATTFLTMAYIIFVNPAILADAGMDKGAVFVATCLVAAIGSAVMGLYANYPIAQAPGMGLNAYFAYGVVLGMGYSWQVALGAVFLSGCLFLLLAVTRVREAIINAIPHSQKLAISAAIGLFLAMLALQSAGIIVADKVTLVTLGDIRQPQAVLAICGFFAMAALDAKKVPGGIMIVIIALTAIGMGLGLTPYNGVFSMPPSLAPTFLQMDLSGALNLGLVTIVFAFLFVDLFDNAGTLIGLAQRAGMLDEHDRLPRIGRALVADSTAVMVAGVLGSSSTTSYIESAAGIKVGGRTGLTAVVVAVLFVLALFLSPLASAIPAYATAPALMYVACMMARSLAEIGWDDPTEAAPAMVTILTMPLTFSIAHGITFGLIAYAAIKLVSGRWREISPTVAVLAAVFAAKYAFLG